MPFPPSKNRATPEDPNAAAVAEEDRVLREKLAAANWTNNQNQQSYTEHAVLTEAKVKADIVRDRGQKHTRS